MVRWRGDLAARPLAPADAIAPCSRCKTPVPLDEQNVHATTALCDFCRELTINRQQER